MAQSVSLRPAFARRHGTRATEGEAKLTMEFMRCVMSLPISTFRPRMRALRFARSGTYQHLPMADAASVSGGRSEVVPSSVSTAKAARALKCPKTCSERE